MAVVYDPSGGFVTGGGWIDSPVNTDYEYMQVGGKATFGFVSKYAKGAKVPSGDTEFQFYAAGLSFQSTAYEWLVVNQAGTNAQFKGSGTINGAGSYQFMLWATRWRPGHLPHQDLDRRRPAGERGVRQWRRPSDRRRQHRSAQGQVARDQRLQPWRTPAP